MILVVVVLFVAIVDMVRAVSTVQATVVYVRDM